MNRRPRTVLCPHEGRVSLQISMDRFKFAIPRFSSISPAQRCLNSERGLTLIEIVVVLIILGAVFGILVPRVFTGAEKAKVDLTVTKMNQLKAYIAEYRLRYNSLPNSLNDLVSCNQASGAVCVPVATADELKDSWGNPFTYAIEGGGRSYRLRSMGSDGQSGGSGVNADPEISGP